MKDNAAVEELRSLLEKFGVADDLDWVSAVLFVRNLVANLGIYTEQQKTAIQKTVLMEIAKKDLSSKAFAQVIDHIERFIKSNEDSNQLQRTLEHERKATMALADEMSSLFTTLKRSQSRQEESIDRFGQKTVKAVEEGTNKSGIVKQVRSLLTELVTELKEEARSWEERAKALERNANYDPLLSELFNRRSLDAYLDDVVVESLSRGTELSLMMIDVDHFKNVNDTYGHLVGDDLLRALSKIIINHAVVFEGYAARYGGEELVVVCPMNLERAMIHAEAIRSDVEGYEFVARTDGWLGDPVHFTVSMGVAQLEQGWDAQHLVAAADSALYEAKRSGRNKVLPHGQGKAKAD